MKNKKIFKLFCLFLVVVFGLIAFNIEKSSASSCSVRIVSPKDGDYIEAGQSIPVKIFIDCPYAYKVDYSLLNIESGYKQTQTFAGIIDYGNVTLNSYSGSNVTAVLRNYTSDSITFTVVLYKCISPKDFTGGTCNSWESVTTSVRLKIKQAQTPTPTTPAPSALDVACYATPHPAKVGQSVKVYATVSGGTPSYSYSWSGDISGNTKDVYKTFNTEGVYGFTVTVTDSKNQTKSAKCATYVEGTTPTPTTPTPTYPPAPTRYTCNWSTYSCQPSLLGEYSTASSCQNACQPTIQPMRYTCNWSTYSCQPSTTGEYSSPSACQNACQPTIQPMRYTCNWATYSCQPSTTGEYSSPSACQSACQPTIQPTRYTCNWSTYSCQASSLGEYSSNSACAASCVAITPPPVTRYECNSSTYSCNVSNNGPYTSYTECFYDCQAPKYSCNKSTNQCYVDSNGNFTSLVDCNESCAKKPITVKITANPSIIDRGQSSTLIWTSSNATYCTATNGWSGSKVINGSQLVNPIATTTYTITCYNGSGDSATDTAIVSVRDINPSVDLNAYPSTIYRGQTAILSWNSQNVVSCSASNGWSGSKAINGTETIAPIVTTIYTITCIGTNGTTVSDSATVNVIDQQTDNVLAITKLGRNLSNGDQSYAKVIRAKKGDVIEFYILVSNVNSTKYANNTIVLDKLPVGLNYYINTTKIDNIANADGITASGISIGVLRPGEKKIVTFQAIAGEIIGQYTLTNIAEARADNVNLVSDTATVTYSAVLGASTIATGPVETGLLLSTLSIAITGSAWYYLNKTEKGKKLLKEMETKRIQKKIDSLR